MKFLFLFCVLFIATQAFEKVPDPATTNLVKNLFEKFAKDNHVPCLVAGYQVLATKNGSLVGEQRYAFHNMDGLADVENEVPCRVNTVLRVASVSKAIGSGLVASLVEQGKLHWDDDVNKYVPESVFPKKTFNGK